MTLLRKFFNQTRKPEGFLGKLMLSGMNSGHAKLADWGFTHLPELTVSAAVDLGCGGGRNAGELLKKYPTAQVTAIDYSPLCVEKATRYNRAMIAAGRCTVRQGDVSNLRLPESSFDLATAFETVYFWPGLEKCFAQAAKVLKRGGTFCGCFYVQGGCKRTDWFIRHLYQPKGFFTPPYETETSLRQRLSALYSTVNVTSVEGIGCFRCVKG